MKPAFLALCVAALLCAAAGASAQPAESGRRQLVSYAVFSLQQRAAVDANLVHRRYWQRQEKLRHAVESAQRRSNDTLRPQRLVRVAVPLNRSTGDSLGNAKR